MLVTSPQREFLPGRHPDRDETGQAALPFNFQRIRPYYGERSAEEGCVWRVTVPSDCGAPWPLCDFFEECRWMGVGPCFA